MSQFVQLEINLWDTLAEAALVPEDANLQQLWTTLEATIAPLDVQDSLRVAADAIALLVKIFRERSLLTLEELQALTSDEGPIMPLDAFDRYVRQSMEVDFEQFIEPLPAPPRKAPSGNPNQFPTDGRSVVTVLDKEALLQALEEQEIQQELEEEVIKTKVLDIAHTEDVSACVSALARWMQQYNGKAISLLLLQQALGIPLVAVWLGLLLGGLDLYEWEQHGDFYSDAGEIWLQNKSLSLTRHH